MAKAVVFGAAGVSGWGLCRALLDYPSRDAYSSVIGLTLHTVTKEKDLFTKDERLSLHDGVDLNAPEDRVLEQLSQIPGFSDSTHIYYVACGLSPLYDFGETAQINVQMFQTALKATVNLCKCLSHFSWQSGSLWYGGPFRAQVEHQGVKLPPPPFAESGPRIPDPIGGMIPFYKQQDIISCFHRKLKERNAASWNWTSPRADTIIGFSPHASRHNLTMAIGSYLAIVRLLSPRGTEVAFPGTEVSYKAPFTVTTQTHLAQMTIQLSLAADIHSEICSEAFNISTKSAAPVTWEFLWPQLVSFFGLRGVGPTSARKGVPLLFGSDWVEKNREALIAAEAKAKDLIPGLDKRVPWKYLQFLLGAEVERALETSKVTTLAREKGWEIEMPNVKDAFFQAWELACAAHMLPKFEVAS